MDFFVVRKYSAQPSCCSYFYSFLLVGDVAKKILPRRHWKSTPAFQAHTTHWLREQMKTLDNRLGEDGDGIEGAP